MGYPRVLLADDHSEIRERIADMLKDNFDIVASVGNGQEALLATLAIKPDLLISDICMPIIDGIQLACKLRNSGCDTKIIILTVHNDADFVEAAFSSGALGYVLKPNIETDLKPAPFIKCWRGDSSPQSFCSIGLRDLNRTDSCRNDMMPHTAPCRHCSLLRASPLSQ